LIDLISAFNFATLGSSTFAAFFAPVFLSFPFFPTPDPTSYTTSSFTSSIITSLTSLEICSSNALIYN